MMIPGPAAKQVVVLGQLTALRLIEVPEPWADQLEPPSLVSKIMPLPATTKHVVTLGQLIVLPAAPKLFDQVAPPLVVVRTPPAPAAKQVLVVGQLIPPSEFRMPASWLDHVVPPSIVARIVAKPTA
jgi:hypothetical protein